MKSFILSIVTLMMIFTLGIYSQNKDQKTDTTKVPQYVYPTEVMVTAPRINIPFKENPSATSIVDQKTLRTMVRGISADEALSLVPGVRVENQADGERLHLSIRGQGILSEHGIRGIKILLDGIPLNDPTGFAPDLYDVDWETVSNVEVLRGPSAALYGGGASGGIINITTLCGGIKPFNAEAFSSFGTNGFWKAFVQTNGSSDNINYRVSYSRIMGDGYRIHSAFQGQNFSSKINFNLSDKVNLTQLLSYTYYSNENPEGLNLAQLALDPRTPNDDAVPRDELQQTSRFTGGFVGDVKINDNQILNFNAYLRTTGYKELGSRYMWHDRYFTPGGTIQYQFSSGNENLKNFISVGSDFQWQRIDEYIDTNLVGGLEGSTLLSNETIDQGGIGTFILDRIEIGKQWSVMLNVRYDNITNKLTDLLIDAINLSGSKNFDKVTARAGVTYSPTDNLNIYASWGQGFLPPATEELASNPVNPGGFNMNLEPSTSQGFDLGFRGTPVKEVYYDIDGFYMTSDKDFDRYRILPSRIGETFYRNAGSSRRFGLEASFEVEPISPVTFQLAYTYQNFKYTAPDSIDGNWLPNCPQHQLYADLEYRFLNNFTVGAGVQYNSKWTIYTDNPNIYQDGFTLVNARLAYNWDIKYTHGEVSLNVKNLFNKKWVAFTEPDPDGNSYQPGPTREIFGNVKIGL